jgi:hypothetical protein
MGGGNWPGSRPEALPPRAKKDDKAIAHAAAGIAREDQEALACAVRGSALANQKNHDQAAADLEKAAQLDGKFAELKTTHEQQLAEERRQADRFQDRPFHRLSDPPKLIDLSKATFIDRSESKPSNPFRGLSGLPVPGGSGLASFFSWGR